jgi:hypothetical protein
VFFKPLGDAFLSTTYYVGRSHTNDLIIEHVKAADSGVYLCYASLRYEPITVIIDAYSLAVNSKRYDYEVYSGEMLTLPSQSISLIHAYEDTIEEWFFNETKVNGSNRFIVRNSSLTIAKTTALDKGIYECRVTSKKTQQTWVSTRVSVNVKANLVVFSYLAVVVSLAVGAVLLTAVHVFRKWRVYRIAHN